MTTSNISINDKFSKTKKRSREELWDDDDEPEIVPIVKTSFNTPKAPERKLKRIHTFFGEEGSEAITTVTVLNKKNQTKLAIPKIPATTTLPKTNRYFLTQQPAMMFGHKNNFDKACISCASTSHDVYDCPNVVCSACCRIGHKSNKCPYKGTQACSWCDKPGHSGNKCPVKKFLIKQEDAQSAVCISCGKSGHLNCSKPTKKTEFSCFNCGSFHYGINCKRRLYNDILKVGGLKILDFESSANEKTKMFNFLKNEFAIN
ncbi:hypothetical protein AKO1_007767 [Acrasis kona]|uniref:CCHC-type domain-containing protein n=1 Tax=Acrasis kona TaxID=1008807 RepID=A0AAW2YQN8_9EUKA